MRVCVWCVCVCVFLFSGMFHYTSNTICSVLAFFSLNVLQYNMYILLSTKLGLDPLLFCLLHFYSLVV